MGRVHIVLATIAVTKELIYYNANANVQYKWIPT